MDSSSRKLSPNVVGRLSLYRRILLLLATEGQGMVFSHVLARLAGATASQVRRDLMAIGYMGSPNQGYDVCGLADAISQLLDAKGAQPVVLLGAGNLGRAVLDHIRQCHAKLQVIAVFDNDTGKIGRVISGVSTHGLDDLVSIIGVNGVDVAILTLPAAHAQSAADLLVSAGVHSLLNFTNVRLRVPDGVFIEDMDIGIALAKVAFFGRREEGRQGE